MCHAREAVNPGNNSLVCFPDLYFEGSWHVQEKNERVDEGSSAEAPTGNADSSGCSEWVTANKIAKPQAFYFGYRFRGVREQLRLSWDLSARGRAALRSELSKKSIPLERTKIKQQTVCASGLMECRCQCPCQ